MKQFQLVHAATNGGRSATSGGAIVTYKSSLSAKELVAFEKDADPKVKENKKLFHQIGVECKTMDAAYSSLRGIVDKFRQQNIYLDDPPSIVTASYYIAEKHDKASVDTIDRYVSNLRQLLRCPPDIVPANPSITLSLPAWVTVGDQVDVPLKVNGRDELWHGVVVSTGLKQCHIYWVGCPAYKSTKRQNNGNPVKMDRQILRWHQQGAAREGAFPEYSVSWIKSNYIPKSWGTPPVQIVDDEGGEPRPANLLPNPNSKVEPKPLKNAEVEEDRSKRKPNPAPPSSGKGKVRGRGKGATETVNEKKKPKEDSSLQRTTLIEPSLFNWLAPFLAPNQLADDLALLQRNLNVNRDENFFNHYLQLLQQLRHGQGVMYSAASKFRTYYEQQVEALQNYKVFEVKKNDSRRREFILSMDTTLAAKYADAFTRNEIVVLCCLLASPALTFTNIDQKTTVAKKSGMIRGMSFLSPIVEAFFHDRLRQLGVINDKDHPKYMQPLSTVVLCSTYCYHQFVTWGHGDEFSSKIDLVFTLEGFPQFLSVNGKYVRVEHESEVMYAKVMSAANAVSLGLTTAGLVIDNYDWARVIVIKGQTAKVYPFLSVGLGEDADPICVASFTLSKRLDQSGCHVIRPAMFSHLNDSGEAVYQDIVTGPSISVGSERSKGSVSLEYGSNLIPRCAPSPHSFQPAALDEQAGHVDGNYCCVKDQWAQVSHKLYRVFDHVPAKVNADVSAPVFLDGLAHENSMSFLFNVNGKTTLTFPTEDAPAPRRQGDLVDPVPFGGFSAFAFIKKHKGSRYGLDPNDRPHLYAHSGDLRQFPVSSFGNLVVVLAAKQRIENIRKCLSGGDLSQVAKLRLQEVETALKHFILGVLTTVTFKEESESAILNDVIQKAKAQAQGGKQ